MRSQLIRIASELPKGNPTRRRLLQALEGKAARPQTIRKRTSIVLYPEDFRKPSQWRTLLDALDLPYGEQTGNREPEELTLHISGAEFNEYIPTMPR